MAKKDRFASKARMTITVNGIEFQRSKGSSGFTQKDLARCLGEKQQCTAEGAEHLVIVADRSAIAALHAKGVLAVHPNDLRQDPENPNIIHYPVPPGF
jgi:hypothetical protein